MIPWLDDFVSLSADRLQALPVDHDARRMLHERGVSEDQKARYRIGWIPDPGGVKSSTPEFWEWLKRYGWDALVFPLMDPLGQVIGLEVRSQKLKSYKDFIAQPKELCPPAFGLQFALPHMFHSRRAVVVEGIFDYFAMRVSTPDVIAVLTSNTSLGLRRLLSRYADRVVCLFDMDSPGRRGCYRLAGLPIPVQYQNDKDASSRPPVPPPYLVSIPFYSEHDPGDLYKKGKFEEIQRLARTGLFADQPISTSAVTP